MSLSSWPVLIAVTLLTVAGMEVFAWWAHRFIMHEWGWGWHRSHHEEREGLFEKNDLYAVVFAGFSILLFLLGHVFAIPLITAFATGITIYGFLYFVVHDGLVHQRWPFRHIPHRGYAKRLVQAHRLHHAVQGREHGVSFGFLYAPPIEKLQRELKASGVIARERDLARGREAARAGQ
ncbi:MULTISPECIES: sterol desaturase family protein [unclassified Aureimonas]|uniref:sterol desaturase family protein n=1 Tax=unclassified Aureimonas TaxID=2615206 RepID=UPI0006FF7B42|nr:MULTISPECIES: sterol desaturase family protein [unclassified Aureimonas]KQT69691.1 beta-carotene hydroxylase [Aureimonas sp. Leaf427]KQT76156.1 beta-carotene hydroxylase [Aureimonas sp. Leaf460]